MFFRICPHQFTNSPISWNSRHQCTKQTFAKMHVTWWAGGSFINRETAIRTIGKLGCPTTCSSTVGDCKTAALSFLKKNGIKTVWCSTCAVKIEQSLNRKITVFLKNGFYPFKGCIFSPGDNSFLLTRHFPSAIKNSKMSFWIPRRIFLRVQGLLPLIR